MFNKFVCIFMTTLALSAHAAEQAVWVTGTVKAVDTSKQQLKIKHGPLTNLNMGAMTMSFAVAKPEMLKQVKKNDAISFQAEDINGTLTVTQLKRKQ